MSDWSRMGVQVHPEIVVMARTMPMNTPRCPRGECRVSLRWDPERRVWVCPACHWRERR